MTDNTPNMLKPTVQKLKDMRGRITRYRAALGPVASDGPTAGEAVYTCGRDVNSALARLAVGPIIGIWRGHVYVVAPDVDGWRYWLDTFSSPNFNVLIRGGSEFAVESALYHLAQSVWTHDTSDDVVFVSDLPVNIRAELISYFGWQRRFKAAHDAGYGDEAARQMADQHTTVVQGGA